jgi:hypothetical protein
MTTSRWLIDRRTLLRGAGVALALPFLDAMVPPLLYGAEPKVVPRKVPVRFAAMYVPNGLVPPPEGKGPDRWTPKDGTLNELPELLMPLDKVRSDVVVLTGMHNALPIKTEGGHHPRATGFLCSSMVHGGKRATEGGDIDSGSPSVDQLLAEHLGAFTRLPSLELAMEAPQKGFAQNTGENVLYGCHLSWSSRSTPVAPEVRPKAVFDRLFRSQSDGSKVGPVTSVHDDNSVLDAVLENLTGFRNGLGVDDKRKLDEYATSVRAVEKRLSAEVKAMKEPRRVDPAATRALPELERRAVTANDPGRKGDPSETMRLMMDLLVLAFWTDTTRIATFHLGNEVSGRNFSFLPGVTGAHHELSHHDNKTDKMAQYAKIGAWHVGQYAYLVEQLSKIKDGKGRLIDNCILLIGAGSRDGQKHDGKNLPILLAGGGGGTIVGGRHLNVGMGTPLANLHGEIALRMGLQLPSFADSSGPLKGL